MQYLGALGYDLHTDVYLGTDYGASERRERMVCIAVSKGLNFDNMLNEIADHIKACKTPHTPLADVLETLPLDHSALEGG